jgi:hypothetical protein
MGFDVVLAHVRETQWCVVKNRIDPHLSSAEN